MTDGEKVKAIRKSLGMTLVDFGSRIGISNPAVSMIEHGKNGVSEVVKRSIIREFGISQEWWDTESGPMFIPMSESEEVSLFLGDILKGDNDFRRRFVAVLSRLSDNEWKMLEKRAKEIAEEI